MTIQEIIKKLENEEEVNFNVAESLIGGSTNLLCRFNNFKDWMRKKNMRKPMTAVLRHPEGSTLGFIITKKMYITLPSGNVYLSFHRSSSISNAEIEGKVDELQFSITSGNVTNYIYNFSGGKIEDFMDLNQINWTRKYEYEQDEINIDFKYYFHKRVLEIKLSRAVSVDSSFYHKIDSYIKDEVLLFCHILSFCIGTSVEILTKSSFSSEGEEVCFDYISRDTEDSYRNLNAMTPMRELPDLWINFLQHVLKKEDVTYSWLIDSGLFQAIGNLYFDNINEWVLIKLAAALEGLCKSQEHCVIKDDDKYEYIIESALCEIERECKRFDVEHDNIERVKNNIINNKRTLNGYSTRWYVVKTLDELKLKNFRKKHVWRINKAFEMRNTIVHTGWAKKWEVELIEHIKTLRSTIFLIVLARLEYPGKFFFSGHEHKETTSLQEWRS